MEKDCVKNLYCLTFYDEFGGSREGFRIGLFASREEAAAVAARYRREIEGFRTYDCAAEITEVPVVGGHSAQAVYRFAGWNEDSDGNETDVLESPCYGSQAQAAQDLEQAKRETPRQEWAMNLWTIGQCHWQEGFVRR